MKDSTRSIIRNMYKNIFNTKIADLPNTRFFDSVDDAPNQEGWEKTCEHQLIRIAEVDGLVIYDDIAYGDYIVADKKTDKILAYTKSNFFNQNNSIREYSFYHNGNCYLLTDNGLNKQIVDFEDSLENSPKL